MPPRRIRPLLLLATAALLQPRLRAWFGNDAYDDYAAGDTNNSGGFTYGELGGGDPNAPAWQNAGLFIAEPDPTADPPAPDSAGGAGDGAAAAPAPAEPTPSDPPAAAPAPSDPPADPAPPPDPVSPPDPAPPADPPPVPGPAPNPSPDPLPAPPPDPPVATPAPPPAPTINDKTATIEAPAAGPVGRIRFNAGGHDAHVVNQGTAAGSTFIWTDPAGLQVSPWPDFSGPRPAAAGPADTPLPPVPLAPAGIQP
jgi:hypothetical protein